MHVKGVWINVKSLEIDGKGLKGGDEGVRLYRRELRRKTDSCPFVLTFPMLIIKENYL
jgi:hypothetical protein